MFIRNLKLSDAADAARIFHQSWQISFAKYLDPAIVAKFTYDSCFDSWQKLLQDTHSSLRHFGAFEDDSLLGTMSIGPSRIKGESWIELWAMHVAQAKQRSGVGTQLLKEAFKFAKEGQYPFLHLVCIKDNRQALDFYLKHGGKIGSDFNQRGFQEVEVYWEVPDLSLSF